MGQLLSEPWYFAVRLREESARSRRSGSLFSVVVFTSLPGYGEHPEVTCVRRLPAILANVRDTDTVCRIADDRIAVLLIDATAEGSARAADRLLARLADEASRWDAGMIQAASCGALIDEIEAAA
jgi:hypothetical protein